MLYTLSIGFAIGAGYCLPLVAFFESSQSRLVLFSKLLFLVKEVEVELEEEAIH